jgi:hypothetical protein
VEEGCVAIVSENLMPPSSRYLAASAHSSETVATEFYTESSAQNSLNNNIKYHRNKLNITGMVRG